MDFTEQIEKLFIFFELNLSKANNELMLGIKKDYNNDYNIIASFFKDYLTLKNGYIECCNENIFGDFVSYFRNVSILKQTDSLIQEIYNYSKYYLVLIFEKKFEFSLIDNEIIGYLETINLFYRMELYPYLLNKIEKFINLKIDRNIFSSMLKSLVDIVVEKDIKSDNEKFNLVLIDYEINKNIINKKQTVRKLVG